MPAEPSGPQVIQSYGGGGFRISGVAWQGSVIVLRDGTSAWDVADAGEIGADALAAITTAEPAVEILLIGTGPTMRPVSSELRTALKASGITVDAMDTGAACRTYNVLAAEDRRIAAALIAVA